jgi:hypothetical protein
MIPHECGKKAPRGMMWRMSGRVHGPGMCLLSRDAIAARMEIASLLQLSNFVATAEDIEDSVGYV